jgi:hypothetical protein
MSLRNLKEFEEFEASHGSSNFYSEERRDALVRFMKQFVPRRALMGERKPMFLLPPPKIRNMRRDGTRAVPVTGIRFVEIRRTVTFRSVGGLERGPDEAVLKIDVSGIPFSR